MLGVKLDYNMSAWKKTLIAGLISYIDAGSIVAGASGLSMWAEYLGMSSVQMGLLAALSSNTGGAALGALIGGKLCDKYGRKFVYNYALLLYMVGVLIICLATNYPMFLIGYVIVGLTVGADVVASWTFIAEEAPSDNRAKHCGSAQIAWMLGPVVVFLASIPLNEMFGLLGNRLIFAHLIVVSAWIWYQRLKMPESTEWVAAKKRSEELAAKGIKERKASYGDILRGTSLKTVLMCVGVYAMWNLAASTNGFFMPYVYEHVGNLSNSMALGLTALNFVVCMVTTVIFMYTADKFSQDFQYLLRFGPVELGSLDSAWGYATDLDVVLLHYRMGLVHAAAVLSAVELRTVPSKISCYCSGLYLLRNSFCSSHLGLRCATDYGSSWFPDRCNSHDWLRSC